MPRASLGLLIVLAFAPVVAGQGPRLLLDNGGHRALVRDVLFTKDGRYLVSASSDTTVRVWDLKRGRSVRVFRGQIGEKERGKLYALALAPDQRTLAVAGWMPGKRQQSGAIRLIDFHTGKVIRLLEGHIATVMRLAWAPDGRRLASSGIDGTARIWDVGSGKSVHVLYPHEGYVAALAFSPNGERLLTGSSGGSAKLWDPRSGKRVKSLRTGRNSITAAAFTPDSRYLITGHKKGAIRLWQARKGRLLRTLGSQRRAVIDLAVSPDGSKVLAGCGTGTGAFESLLLSIPHGSKLGALRHTGIVAATAFSPDGRTAATTDGQTHEILLWQLRPAREKGRLGGRGRPIGAVGFAEDGRSIAWGSAPHTGTVLFTRNILEQSFEIRSEQEYLSLGMARPLRSDQGYTRALYSVGQWSIGTPDNKPHPTLLVRRRRRVVARIALPKGTGKMHTSCTLTPDGRAVISGTAAGRITAYEPARGRKIRSFLGHTAAVNALAVSPDGRYLVSGSDDQTVRLWDGLTGNLLLTVFEGTDKEWVAWMPGGYYAASLLGDHYLGWHINQGVENAARYYPAFRFARTFCEPRVVAAYIRSGGDIRRAVALANHGRPSALHVAQTPVKSIFKLLPPAVSFRAPTAENVLANAPRIRVKAAANALNREPITDIWLLLNGRRLDPARSVSREQSGQKMIAGLHARIEASVPLTQRENRIAVIAANRYSHARPQTLHVQWPAGPRLGAPSTEARYRPDLYVLAIGISKHRDEAWNLGFADADAREIAKRLATRGSNMFGTVRSRVLCDETATRPAVLDGLNWLASNAGQKDVALVFLAGRAFRDEWGTHYFLPYDGTGADPRGSSIKWFDVQQILARLPAKTVLMIDTSRNGAAADQDRHADDTDITEALRQLLTIESGVILMAAATGRERSLEFKEWQHGAFAKALIEGLDGQADANADKTVAVTELGRYLTRRVAQLTRDAQHAVVYIPLTVPDFAIAGQ